MQRFPDCPFVEAEIMLASATLADVYNFAGFPLDNHLRFYGMALLFA